MNVVEIHNQVPVLLICPLFPHHFVISCITKIQSVAKGGLFYPNSGLVALLELTLNALWREIVWDVYFLEKIACIPSIRMSSFHTVFIALPIFSCLFIL